MSAVIVSRAPAAISTAEVDRLFDWAINVATPNELAWNANEFSQVRDWLKVTKAATALRQKAIRIELIALRKVAQALLTKKLPTHSRAAADWLAGLTDDGFDQLLADLDVKDSPISLYRRAKGESEAITDYFWGRRVASGVVDDGYQDYSFEGLNGAVKRLLEEISVEGEPFTIVAAAARLRTTIENSWEIELPEEMAGEPLREVVRAAIRNGAMRTDSLRNLAGETVRVPEFVTYGEGRTGIVRVPWHAASLAQLRLMTAMRVEQAAAMAERSAQQVRLLEAIEAVGSDGDADVEGLLSQALHQGTLWEPN